jgi:hypothetical protein
MMWKLLGADHPMEAHRLDSQAMFWTGRSADAREGVTAFLEKRPAQFTLRPSCGSAAVLSVVALSHVAGAARLIPESVTLAWAAARRGHRRVELREWGSPGSASRWSRWPSCRI